MQLDETIFDRLSAPAQVLSASNDNGADLPVAYVSDSLKHVTWVLKMDGAKMQSSTSGTLRDGRKFAIILSCEHKAMIAGRRFSEVRLLGRVDAEIVQDVKGRVVA